MFKKKAEYSVFQDGWAGEMEVTKHYPTVWRPQSPSLMRDDDFGIFRGTRAVANSKIGRSLFCRKQWRQSSFNGGFLRATTVTREEIFRLVRKRRGHGQFRTYGSNIKLIYALEALKNALKPPKTRLKHVEQNGTEFSYTPCKHRLYGVQTL